MTTTPTVTRPCRITVRELRFLLSEVEQKLTEDALVMVTSLGRIVVQSPVGKTLDLTPAKSETGGMYFAGLIDLDSTQVEWDPDKARSVASEDFRWAKDQLRETNPEEVTIV